MIEAINDFKCIFENIKDDIRNTRFRIFRNANSELINLYFRLGKIIDDNWKYGNNFVNELSIELKLEFPDMKGFSPRNLKYMLKFAEVWDSFEFVQQVVAQIPWKTNLILLDKIDNNEERKWYANQIIENGWSSNVTRFQIESKLMQRTGKEIFQMRPAGR